MASIKVSNGKLVDQSGTPIFLRGANMSGLENSVIQGGQPWADDGGTPQWATYATWKPNVVRIPLNAACFLNLQVAKTTSATSLGAPFAADTHGNYRQAIKDAIDAARAIGCYIIFDLHWCAPKVTLGGVTQYLAPMAQSPFADADTAIPFWTAFPLWLQSTYPGGINDILFELFNEPFLDSFSAGLSDRDAALKTGGTSTRIVNGTQGGANFEITQAWALAGYQAMVDAIRSTGATNVCIVNGNSYSQSLQQWSKFLPSDPLGQIAFGWHPYPHANRPYGKTGSDVGAGTSSFAQWALQLKAAGHPLILTEDGDTGFRSDHIQYMTDLAWKNFDGYVPWQWNGTQAASYGGGSFYLTQYAADGKTIVPVKGTGDAVLSFFTSLPASNGGTPTMATLTSAISYADTPGFPAGSSVDHVLVNLVDAGSGTVVASQSVAPGTGSVSFANIAPGTYTANAQAFPASGAGYGSAVVSAPFTVAAPVTVTLSLPSAVTLG